MQSFDDELQADIEELLARADADADPDGDAGVDATAAAEHDDLHLTSSIHVFENGTHEHTDASEVSPAPFSMQDDWTPESPRSLLVSTKSQERVQAAHTGRASTAAMAAEVGGAEAEAEVEALLPAGTSISAAKLQSDVAATHQTHPKLDTPFTASSTYRSESTPSVSYVHDHELADRALQEAIAAATEGMAGEDGVGTQDATESTLQKPSQQGYARIDTPSAPLQDPSTSKTTAKQEPESPAFQPSIAGYNHAQAASGEHQEQQEEPSSEEDELADDISVAAMLTSSPQKPHIHSSPNSVLAHGIATVASAPPSTTSNGNDAHEHQRSPDGTGDASSARDVSSLAVGTTYTSTSALRRAACMALQVPLDKIVEKRPAPSIVTLTCHCRAYVQGMQQELAHETITAVGFFLRHNAGCPILSNSSSLTATKVPTTTNGYNGNHSPIAGARAKESSMPPQEAPVPDLQHVSGTQDSDSDSAVVSEQDGSSASQASDNEAEQPPKPRKGAIFPSRQAFRDAIQAYSSYINPGSLVVWTKGEHVIRRNNSLRCYNGREHWKKRTTKKCRFFAKVTGNDPERRVKKLYLKHTGDCEVICQSGQDPLLAEALALEAVNLSEVRNNQVTEVEGLRIGSDILIAQGSQEHLALLEAFDVASMDDLIKLANDPANATTLRTVVDNFRGNGNRALQEVGEHIKPGQIFPHRAGLLRAAQAHSELHVPSSRVRWRSDDSQELICANAGPEDGKGVNRGCKYGLRAELLPNGHLKVLAVHQYHSEDCEAQCAMEESARVLEPEAAPLNTNDPLPPSLHIPGPVGPSKTPEQAALATDLVIARSLALEEAPLILDQMGAQGNGRKKGGRRQQDKLIREAQTLLAKGEDLPPVPVSTGYRIKQSPPHQRKPPPQMPEVGQIFDSAADFGDTVIGASGRPKAKLKFTQNKSGLSYKCTFGGCQFHVRGQHLVEDGVELMGVTVDDVSPSHSAQCVEANRSGPSRQHKSPSTAPSQASTRGGKRKRVRIIHEISSSDDEDDASKDARDDQYDSDSSIEIIRATTGKRRLVARSPDENTTGSQQGGNGQGRPISPARAKRNRELATEEPPKSMHEALLLVNGTNTPIRLTPPQEGEVFRNFKTAEAAIQAYNAYLLPTTRLRVFRNPNRLRVNCKSPECNFRYNCIWNNNPLRPNSVRISTNVSRHTPRCFADVRGSLDMPTVHELVEDSDRLLRQAREFSALQNPSALLQEGSQDDKYRVWCSSPKCKFSVDADFVLKGGTHNGRVQVSHVHAIHGWDCILASAQRFEPRASHEESSDAAVANGANGSVGPDSQEHVHEAPRTESSGVLTSNMPEMPVGQTGREGDAEHEQEPTTQDGPRAPVAEPPNWDDEVDESIGPKVTRVYELPKAFLSEVEEHSKRYYPGTKLKMSLKEKSVTINCRNDHTGCRYEFHAAWFVDTDGVRKLKITDIMPVHADSCRIEIMLSGKNVSWPNALTGKAAQRSRMPNIDPIRLPPKSNKPSGKRSAHESPTTLWSNKKFRYDPDETDDVTVEAKPTVKPSEEAMTSETAQPSTSRVEEASQPSSSAAPDVSEGPATGLAATEVLMERAEAPAELSQGESIPSASVPFELSPSHALPPPSSPPQPQSTIPLPRRTQSSSTSSSSSSSSPSNPSSSPLPELPTPRPPYEGSPNPLSDEAYLKSLDLPPRMVDLFVALGYWTTNDLMTAGGHESDWHPLVEFLNAYLATHRRLPTRPADNELDLIQAYLWERRVMEQVAQEGADSSYNGRARPSRA